MCIGIPMQLLQLDQETLQGWCLPWPAHPRSSASEWVMVNLALVGAVEPGQWLLVFLGSARECLSPERADQVGQALQALTLIRDGQLDQLDHLFADLQQPPQLPEHLRPATVAPAGVHPEQESPT